MKVREAAGRPSLQLSEATKSMAEGFMLTLFCQGSKRLCPEGRFYELLSKETSRRPRLSGR
jgi:hypothetical protein